jgi:hypothetical protein
VSSDPVRVFRAELRAAAARRVRANRRRRRAAVAAGVALFAILIVGGAIAAQSTWFNSASQIRVRFTAAGRAAAIDFPARGSSKCMAAHGSPRVSVRDGWSFQWNAAADAACDPYLAALACGISRAPGERKLIPVMVSACGSAAR